jgi:5,10-methylenetetrahydrofolate reductase
MTKITDALAQSSKPVFIADFTPPRGAEPALLDDAVRLRQADFVSVAYNPGKLVRLDSVTAAYLLKQRFGTDTVFNLSPRDMNKIALESRLLGAATLGLENVLVLQGDGLTEREKAASVADYTATALIAAARTLNKGLDYRKSKLDSAGDFCIGAALDLGREAGAEVALTHKKVEAGAHFFIAQPVFSAEPVEAFHEAYRAATGHALTVPIFWGVQILAKDGVRFSSIPAGVRKEVEQGRDGVEIAREAYDSLRGRGENAFYLIAPIMRGGARDYDAASRFLAEVTQA